MAPPPHTQVKLSQEEKQAIDDLLKIVGTDLTAIEIRGKRIAIEHLDSLEEYGQEVGFKDPSYLKLKYLADNAGGKDHT